MKFWVSLKKDSLFLIILCNFWSAEKKQSFPPCKTLNKQQMGIVYVAKLKKCGNRLTLIKHCSIKFGFFA